MSPIGGGKSTGGSIELPPDPAVPGPVGPQDAQNMAKMTGVILQGVKNMVRPPHAKFAVP
jgi:hypothetical protein